MIDELEQHVLSGSLNLFKRGVLAVNAQPSEFTVRRNRWQVDDCDPRWNVHTGDGFASIHKHDSAAI